MDTATAGGRWEFRLAFGLGLFDIEQLGRENSRLAGTFTETAGTENCDCCSVDLIRPVDYVGAQVTVDNGTARVRPWRKFLSLRQHCDANLPYLGK